MPGGTGGIRCVCSRPAVTTDCRGCRFQGCALPYYPTKDETAAYLEAYAREFELPVRTGVKVDTLPKVGDRFGAPCAQSETATGVGTMRTIFSLPERSVPNVCLQRHAVGGDALNSP